MPDGPFFYVLKHESMFETIDLVCLFPSPAIVAKVELTRIPLWGRLAVAHGIIPVERQAGASALRVMMKAAKAALAMGRRSEEHTSELQSLMRNSYAVFGLKKKNDNKSEKVVAMIE